MTDRRVNSAYQSQLADWSTLEIARHADTILQIVDTPAWQALKTLVAGRRAQLLAQVTNSRIPYEEMTRLAGEIRGLDAWEEAADTLLEVAEDQERALVAEST